MTESADSETKSNIQDAAGVSDVLPAGTVLGDYTILRVLGQGGFGVTYLAHDAGLDQDVVLKENMPAQFAGRGGDSLTVTSRGGKEGADSFAWATQRFLDEARLLARLSHPNIVRVLRAFSALGTAYYVMPWVGGRDLKQFAAARGGVDEAFLRGVLSKLLPALSYLHGNNLLHRDIKPGNILCADDGTPILIDFGTARALVSERSQTMVESAGYTPMEQIQSHGNTGPWTDLYALGATLYALITGEHPPRSSDRVGEKDSYVPLAGRAELKDKFGADFLEGIDKALALWPPRRWQSADEWMEALNGEPESAPVRHEPKPSSPAVRSAARPAAPPQEKPSSHMAGAILSTIFCFLPFGIVAIVKASNVNKFWFSGQRREAWEASKSARSWIIWSVVTSAAVILIYAVSMLLIGGTAYLNHKTDADRQMAQSNLQSVHRMLGQFKADYGCYPCDITADQLQDEKPDLYFGELTGEYSNCYFRQIYYSAANDSERPFFANLSVAGKATMEPDERMANGNALARGENGMSYVLRKGSDDPNRKEPVGKNNVPLAFCSVYPADHAYSGGNIAFDMTSFTGHALVLYGDGSVKDLKDVLDEDPTNDEKGTIKAGTEVFPCTRGGRDTADDYLVLPPEL